MKFISTQKKSPPLTFSEAVLQSLAPDGGLYVPDKFPQFSLKDFDGRKSLAEIAKCLLLPFLAGDFLEPSLGSLCDETFQFPIPLVELDASTSVLELFHGPTAAFKDVGAGFLANCLNLLPPKTKKRRTVLVATSGDTGGAVAAAFHRKPGIEVLVLFPKGKISARQEKQLTAWGDNVKALAVRGDFDDCQRLVKSAFQDSWWKENREIVSANSINLGRLLPQQVYYAASALWYQRSKGKVPNYVIPTGNLGNAVAALWAKRCGLPIGKVVLATNANRPIVNYFEGSAWKPEATLSTLANAMDVGNPSNIERLLSLYPDRAGLLEDVSALSVDDNEIKQAIVAVQTKFGKIFCPHSATAASALEKQTIAPWILVATAHPAKFESVVEPLIKKSVEIPATLATLLAKPSLATEIDANAEALRRALN